MKNTGRWETIEPHSKLRLSDSDDDVSKNDFSDDDDVISDDESRRITTE